MAYPRTLRIVLCAIQLDLVVYPFYVSIYNAQKNQYLNFNYWRKQTISYNLSPVPFVDFSLRRRKPYFRNFKTIMCHK